ncbi:MAG: hypothetical protein KDI88_12895 [Gammaproteobacteria bacterium]|nr:hypothetical protein [Gammaproteobacteria bacterium]
MSTKLLITGARERPRGFELGDGKLYGAAVLLRLDVETGETEILLEKTDTGEHYPPEHPNLQFTAGCTAPDTLWLPTDTEIYEIDYPSMQVRQVISHPCFQNVHSANLIDGSLWVTSTGIDTVVQIDPASGEIERLINAEHKPTWHRFSSDVDYRLVHSTRPHDCHPNYVFRHAGEYWVTRCTQEDAVGLEDASKHIDISGEGNSISVHDGVVIDDRAYFTSVDGCLVIADLPSQEVVERIDICQEQNLGRIGWCRGLHIEDDLVWFGFSSIRRTRQSRKLAWLGSSFDKVLGRPACVIAYDLRRRKMVRRFDIRDHAVDAIYGIFPEPTKEAQS